MTKKLETRIKQKTQARKRKNKGSRKVRIGATVVSVLCILMFATMIACLIFFTSLLDGKPTLQLKDFENQESSEIYDSKGNMIAEVGMTIRENVHYEDIPNCVIDAFVSIEDSRFFVHNGFDIPRFAAAMVNNVISRSFVQGGSTLTMQLVKNTYFVDDETGQGAASSLERKAQEIVLATELEGETNKKTVFEYYVNKINFGGDRNIRGIQKAANYYFNKDVQNLNIAEAALLSGVINAPYAYNPYRYLEDSTQRRNEVLYQMYNHGYINETEYQLAKSIKVEDLLVAESDRLDQNTSENTVYQAYVDAVLAEVQEKFNVDPYSTPVRIYTYMDAEVQKVADDIQSGKLEEIDYVDDYYDVAAVSVNNQTGAINAIVGGRNYASGGQLLLNHATEQYKQPGSTFKPVLDYILAFENLGWATSHVVVDKPIVYAGTDTVIVNSTGRYSGEVRVRDAVGISINTTAIQALQEVLEATSVEYVVDYLNKMGFSDVTVDNFNIQYAIGGAELQVSCKQMAGAYAAILNGGKYIEPHTIAKVEFMDGREPITPVYESTQAVSEAASFLMSDILKSNVDNYYVYNLLRDDYAVYAKTGTTDWGSSGLELGIPRGADKDIWVCAGTSEYTIATWNGYASGSAEHTSYITDEAYEKNVRMNMTNLLLDANVKVHGEPARIEQPDSVTTITHVLGTFPYVSVVEGMKSEYITSGYIKTEDAKLVSIDTVKLENIDASKAKVNLNSYDHYLDFTWPEYPDETMTKLSDSKLDISLKRDDGSIIVAATGTKIFDYTWLFGRVMYKADIKVNGNKIDTVQSEKATFSSQYSFTPGDKIEACLYYGFADVDNPKSDNQACFSYTLEDSAVSIDLPSGKKTISELQNYKPFVDYGMEVAIKEQKTNNSNLDGTYSFSVVFANSNGQANEYAEGGHISAQASQLYGAKMTITYFSYGQQASITMDVRADDIKPGSTVNLKLNGASGNVTWFIQGTAPTGVTIDSASGKLTIGNNVSSGTKFTVAASDDSGSTYTIDIAVK